MKNFYIDLNVYCLYFSINQCLIETVQAFSPCVLVILHLYFFDFYEFPYSKIYYKNDKGKRGNLSHFL